MRLALLRVRERHAKNILRRMYVEREKEEARKNWRLAENGKIEEASKYPNSVVSAYSLLMKDVIVQCFSEFADTESTWWNYLAVQLSVNDAIRIGARS